eukprot:jgi/Mesvir1/7805/Mv11747-RA.1
MPAAPPGVVRPSPPPRLPPPPPTVKPPPPSNFFPMPSPPPAAPSPPPPPPQKDLSITVQSESGADVFTDEIAKLLVAVDGKHVEDSGDVLVTLDMSKSGGSGGESSSSRRHILADGTQNHCALFVLTRAEPTQGTCGDLDYDTCTVACNLGTVVTGVRVFVYVELRSDVPGAQLLLGAAARPEQSQIVAYDESIQGSQGEDIDYVVFNELTRPVIIPDYRELVLVDADGLNRTRKVWYGVKSPLRFYVRFRTDMDCTLTPDAVDTFGTAAVQAVAWSAEGGTWSSLWQAARELTFEVLPYQDGLIWLQFKPGYCRDSAGRQNLRSSRSALLYDGTRPTATVVPLHAHITSDEVLTFAVQWSEPVRYFNSTGVTVINGNILGFNTTTSKVGYFEIYVHPSADDFVFLLVEERAAWDMANNYNLEVGGVQVQHYTKNNGTKDLSNYAAIVMAAGVAAGVLSGVASSASGGGLGSLATMLGHVQLIQMMNGVDIPADPIVYESTNSMKWLSFVFPIPFLEDLNEKTEARPAPIAGVTPSPPTAARKLRLRVLLATDEPVAPATPPSPTNSTMNCLATPLLCDLEHISAAAESARNAVEDPPPVPSYPELDDFQGLGDFLSVMFVSAIQVVTVLLVHFLAIRVWWALHRRWPHKYKDYPKFLMFPMLEIFAGMMVIPAFTRASAFFTTSGEFLSKPIGIFLLLTFPCLFYTYIAYVIIWRVIQNKCCVYRVSVKKSEKFIGIAEGAETEERVGEWKDPNASKFKDAVAQYGLLFASYGGPVEDETTEAADVEAGADKAGGKLPGGNPKAAGSPKKTKRKMSRKFTFSRSFTGRSFVGHGFRDGQSFTGGRNFFDDDVGGNRRRGGGYRRRARVDDPGADDGAAARFVHTRCVHETAYDGRSVRDQSEGLPPDAGRVVGGQGVGDNHRSSSFSWRLHAVGSATVDISRHAQPVGMSRIPPIAQGNLRRMSALSAFLLIDVLYVFFTQPQLKRVDWVVALGSTALEFGIVMCGLMLLVGDASRNKSYRSSVSHAMLALMMTAILLQMVGQFIELYSVGKEWIEKRREKAQQQQGEPLPAPDGATGPSPGLTLPLKKKRPTFGLQAMIDAFESAGKRRQIARSQGVDAGDKDGTLPPATTKEEDRTSTSGPPERGQGGPGSLGRPTLWQRFQRTYTPLLLWSPRKKETSVEVLLDGAGAMDSPSDSNHPPYAARRSVSRHLVTSPDPEPHGPDMLDADGYIAGRAHGVGGRGGDNERVLDGGNTQDEQEASTDSEPGRSKRRSDKLESGQGDGDVAAEDSEGRCTTPKKSAPTRNNFGGVPKAYAEDLTRIGLASPPRERRASIGSLRMSAEDWRGSAAINIDRVIPLAPREQFPNPSDAYSRSPRPSVSRGGKKPMPAGMRTSRSSTSRGPSLPLSTRAGPGMGEAAPLGTDRSGRGGTDGAMGSGEGGVWDVYIGPAGGFVSVPPPASLDHCDSFGSPRSDCSDDSLAPQTPGKVSMRFHQADEEAGDIPGTPNTPGNPLRMSVLKVAIPPRASAESALPNRRRSVSVVSPTKRGGIHVPAPRRQSLQSDRPEDRPRRASLDESRPRAGAHGGSRRASLDLDRGMRQSVSVTSSPVARSPNRRRLSVGASGTEPASPGTSISITTGARRHVPSVSSPTHRQTIAVSPVVVAFGASLPAVVPEVPSPIRRPKGAISLALAEVAVLGTLAAPTGAAEEMPGSAPSPHDASGDMPGTHNLIPAPPQRESVSTGSGQRGSGPQSHVAVSVWSAPSTPSTSRPGTPRTPATVPPATLSPGASLRRHSVALASPGGSLHKKDNSGPISRGGDGISLASRGAVRSPRHSTDGVLSSVPASRKRESVSSTSSVGSVASAPGVANLQRVQQRRQSDASGHVLAAVAVHKIKAGHERKSMSAGIKPEADVKKEETVKPKLKQGW